MGGCASLPFDNEKEGHEETAASRVRRALAITEGGRQQTGQQKTPPGCEKASEIDYDFIAKALGKLLLFNNLDAVIQKKIVAETYERNVKAGEILIKEGDKGPSSRELYIVKKGKFEVLEHRQGVMMRVNLKERGDCFGEISLMYDFPRSATVAATTDATVWVLTRDTTRKHLKEGQQSEVQQIELFLNSVPILNSLSSDEKTRLVNAVETEVFSANTVIIQQGDPGDLFYIISDGEAVVYETTSEGRKKLNHLFKSDFFGEGALLDNKPRVATVESITVLTCLTLRRETFVELLGPLEDIIIRQKAADVTESRLQLLNNRGAPGNVEAEVRIRKRVKATKGGGGGQNSNGGEQPVRFETITAIGHYEEIAQLLQGGTKVVNEGGAEAFKGPTILHLTEGSLLGGGAFSKVTRVKEATTGRKYALKCMAKSGVAQCPEHVFCEQLITRNLAHPFCIRQYASFKDASNLYLLFDLMPGGDLMDILVSEAVVVKKRVAQGTFRKACLAPKKKMLKGMGEELAKFYIASLVLALEYLHDNDIIYRDLKPENVFVDEEGYIKLGDFGFAKVVESSARTYTFCGTPGYVAPENVLAHGYNCSVDWWGLGVLLYVVLTGRQPFTSPRTDDPMVVMRRIVDDSWNIQYPPYLSSSAKDLIARLLERRPARRLGMLIGRASDVKRHKWFEGFDWDALESRKMKPPRQPQDDCAKRIKDLETTEQTDSTGQTSEASTAHLSEYDMIFQNF
eukprot:g4383.t1